MESVKLGTSDLIISQIILGTVEYGWTIEKADAIKIIRTALDAGMNTIDTSHIYGDGLSEEYVGEAIRKDREKVIICTKGGHIHTGGPRKDKMMQELETSLRRLKTDYVDLYQIHYAVNQSVGVEEMAETLQQMQQSGKVRYTGVSNCYAWQLCRIHELCMQRGWTGPVSIQSHYSLLERDIEGELISYCKESGTALLPFFPLAGGLLAGCYRRGTAPAVNTRAGQLDWARKFYNFYASEENFDLIEKLSDFAQSRGHNPAELAIAWLLCRPAVAAVIVGAGNPEHIWANSKACDWHLSGGELAEISAILGDRDIFLRYPRRLWWEIRDT